MTIKILSDDVASQIAAGEVVERPASVVKELIENALDARATEVDIHIRGAGKQLIEVSDNGKGISREDLPLTAVRHATSKLETAEDLFRVSTLGFRGEALSSIGSVSQMRITSRRAEDEMGCTIKVEGGEAGQVRSVGTPPGTVVRVENLFYNVPARLKFLKTDRTESRHIDRVVTHYALAYPDVRFRLQREGQTVIQTSGSGDPREVLAVIYGVETAKQMIAVIAEEDGIRIEGFISPPDLTRSNRQEMNFFVNQRPVKDIALSKALTQGYHTMLMKGRFPIAVLFLELDPEAVDVNVHPTKAEVRFKDKGEVFKGVSRSVRRALLAHTPVPEIGGPRGRQLWGGGRPNRRGGDQIIDPAWKMAAEVDKADVTDLPDDSRQEVASLPTPILRLIGQVATTYLIAEGPDGLYLIDQHAAHERVLFEKFLKERDRTVHSQALLESVQVEFPPAAADLLEEKIPLLNGLGFKIETFGPHTFVVRAIPSLLGDISPAEALRSVVQELEVDESPLDEKIEEKIIARVCKRAAVKAGQVLSPAEQKALLRDLESCESPRTCPHGRPTMIHLSVDLLERKFGRKGPQ
ncbi:MAG: DNA mismatch repair endonuclease MutL [Anaerolineales bacterium]